MKRRIIALLVTLTLLLATSATAWAHAHPQVTTPEANARLDASPAQIGITYDDPIDPTLSSMLLLDGSGAPIGTTPAPTTGSMQAAVAPNEPLAAGPYTLAWTSTDATDGDQLQGFYTFVMNGGSVGIISGQAQAQARMSGADLMATLTVTAAEDGGSLLRVDLSDARAVERVRIRLSRPDLGEDLLETQRTNDGGWTLNGNEVALPGVWHAIVVVRRTNVFDDAQAGFDFSIDPATGAPSF
jgi:methionine-rich copper-binding protein CopC